MMKKAHFACHGFPDIDKRVMAPLFSLCPTTTVNRIQEPRMHVFYTMGQLRCTDCGQVFEDNLSACPNCGCPASECVREKIAEEQTVVQQVAPPDMPTAPSNNPAAQVVNMNKSKTDWAHYIYECGVIFWNTLTKRYFDFTNRATRREFWSFFIIGSWILPSVWYLLADIVFGSLLAISSRDAETIALTLLIIMAILYVIPFIAVAVRRMHDINKSGWWNLVPWANFFLLLKKSDEGVNDYGEQPIDIV